MTASDSFRAPVSAQPAGPPAVLQLDGIQRSFVSPGTRAPLAVLRAINLVVQPGELLALLGPSGSGKSTLLHLAGLLETPTQGRIFIQGRDCSALSDRERTTIRRHQIGFVYQSHRLLPEFSALENVMIPQMIAGQSRTQARQKAERLLEQVGLSARLAHRPARLSGGEQQRVAIARALANQPQLLLADEPTGNLDFYNAEAVLDLFVHLARERQVATLVATHNWALAQRMDRIVSIEQGVLVALSPDALATE